VSKIFLKWPFNQQQQQKQQQQRPQNRILRHTCCFGSEGPGCPSGYDAGLPKADDAGSIPVNTEIFLISCDSNQVPISGSEPTIIWRSHCNISKWCYRAGKSVFGVAPAIVQWAHYVAYVWTKCLPDHPSGHQFIPCEIKWKNYFELLLLWTTAAPGQNPEARLLLFKETPCFGSPMHSKPNRGFKSTSTWIQFKEMITLSANALNLSNREIRLNLDPTIRKVNRQWK